MDLIDTNSLLHLTTKIWTKEAVISTVCAVEFVCQSLNPMNAVVPSQPADHRDYVNLDQDYDDTVTESCVYEDYIPRPAGAVPPPPAPISKPRGTPHNRSLSLSVLIQFMCAGTASHGYVNVESSAPDPDAENYR